MVEKVVEDVIDKQEGKMSKILGVKRYMGSRAQFVTFIKVSEYCNINCSFCYQGAPEGNMMLKEDHFKVCFENIDYILKRFRELKKKRELKDSTMSICFFGGEPSVNPKAIIRISEYIRDNHKDLHDILHMTMTTNGTNYIPEAIDAMGEASNLNVTIMVSSDYKKCTSDKNRKFKNSNRSVYEIAHENIYKYSKKLNEVNGKEGNFVLVSSVMGDIADLEDLDREEGTLGVVKESAKDLYRQVTRPLMTHNEKDPVPKEYTDKIKEMYKSSFKEVIKSLKDDKDQLIESLVSESFGWNASIVGECNLVNSIRYNGTLAFCNKNKTCTINGEELSVQENRDKVIMNLDYQPEEQMQCSMDKIKYGRKGKGLVSKTALDDLCKVYTFRYTINSLVIDPDIDEEHRARINDWIYYYTTEDYPALLNKEVKHLIDEENLNRVEFVDYIDEFGFYINKHGKILGSVLYEKHLSSLDDLHFMWLNTENLSRSSFFLEKLAERNKAGGADDSII